MKANQSNKLVTTISEYHKILGKFAKKNGNYQTVITFGNEPVGDNEEYELHIFLDFKKIEKPKVKSKLVGLDGRAFVH